MIKLRLFKPGDEKVIATWITNPKEFYITFWQKTHRSLVDGMNATNLDFQYIF